MWSKVAVLSAEIVFNAVANVETGERSATRFIDGSVNTGHS